MSCFAAVHKRVPSGIYLVGSEAMGIRQISWREMTWLIGFVTAELGYLCLLSCSIILIQMIFYACYTDTQSKFKVKFVVWESLFERPLIINILLTTRWFFQLSFQITIWTKFFICQMMATPSISKLAERFLIKRLFVLMIRFKPYSPCKTR